MKNGVPFDVAFDMDPFYRRAMAVKFSQFNGAKFNFARMEFEDDD